MAQRGVTRKGDLWGPRETIAHLAGWEVMATVRIPHIVAGMPPLELADEAQQTVMNDAINAAFVTLIGDQPLGAICDALRQAYQRDVAFLRTLDDTHFQLGQYVYARTQAAIEHCQEHIETLLLTQPWPWVSYTRAETAPSAPTSCSATALSCRGDVRHKR